MYTTDPPAVQNANLERDCSLTGFRSVLGAEDPLLFINNVRYF